MPCQGNYYSFAGCRLWQDEVMPKKQKKRKKPRFRAVEAVKALARERVGTPKASRVVPDKKKKDQKHKPTLRKILEEVQ